MAAVELSRMALDKATDPNIRVFAQMMIDEHGAAGDKLKSVVSGQPFEWPTQLDERRRKTAEELKKNQGGNFDKDYMQAMVEGHRRLTKNGELHLPRMRERMSQRSWTTRSRRRAQAVTTAGDIGTRP
jgi:putative membrane protein